MYFSPLQKEDQEIWWQHFLFRCGCRWCLLTRWSEGPLTHQTLCLQSFCKKVSIICEYSLACGIAKRTKFEYTRSLYWSISARGVKLWTVQCNVWRRQKPVIHYFLQRLGDIVQCQFVLFIQKETAMIGSLTNVISMFAMLTALASLAPPPPSVPPTPFPRGGGLDLVGFSHCPDTWDMFRNKYQGFLVTRGVGGLAYRAFYDFFYICRTKKIGPSPQPLPPRVHALVKQEV